jgi:hypothetical protein
VESQCHSKKLSSFLVHRGLGQRCNLDQAILQGSSEKIYDNELSKF